MTHLLPIVTYSTILLLTSSLKFAFSTLRQLSELTTHTDHFFPNIFSIHSWVYFESIFLFIFNIWSDIEIDEEGISVDNQRNTEIQMPSLLRLEKGIIPDISAFRCYKLTSDSFLCASPAPATVWLTASTDMDTHPSVTSVYKSSTINCKVDCGLPSTFVMKSLALDVRITAFYDI